MNFLFFFTLLAWVAAIDMSDFLGKRATTSSSSTSTTSTSTTTSPTYVYVTITTGGKVITTLTTYVQSFMTTYSTASSASSGSAGLGSISGLVGGIRSYTETTITNGGVGAYSGAVGLAAVVLGVLL